MSTVAQHGTVSLSLIVFDDSALLHNNAALSYIYLSYISIYHIYIHIIYIYIIYTINTIKDFKSLLCSITVDRYSVL